MKIVQIGIYPPPLGGISVHIKRLKQKLEEYGHDCIVLNEGSFQNNSQGIYTFNKYSLIPKLLFTKADIFHFHTININIRMILGLIKKFLRKKVILTIHGDSLLNQLSNTKGTRRKILIKSLLQIDHIVCVNNDTRTQLIERGFNPNKISHIPAFIKPIELEEDKNKIPIEVWDFIFKQEFLISANGNVRFYKNHDLYGIDMLIELINSLVKKGYNVSLLFSLLDVASQNDREKKYYEEMKQKVRDLKLQDKIYFYEVEGSEFYPILNSSRLFIRPTITDGYGVSIAEALSCGVPSIASDVCKRPNGTIEFKSRNMKSLLVTTTKVIQNYESYKNSLQTNAQIDYFNNLLDIYKKL